MTARWPYLRDGFWDTPLAVIRRASREDLQIAARNGAAAAAMALSVAAANGAKDLKSRMFNPAEYQLWLLECRDTVPPRAARVFMRLLNDGVLPGWVPSTVDIEMVQAVAGDIE